MMSQTILHTSLVVHIIGVSMVLGITIANYVAFRQCWKLYGTHKEQGLSAFQAVSKFQIVGITGLLLLILSGIIMLYLFQWTFYELLWFKIKLCLVLLIFINGFTTGRIQTLKLMAFLSEVSATGESPKDIALLKRNLRIFHLTQLLLFFLIIVVSVFRFS